MSACALPVWYGDEIVASTLVDAERYDELGAWAWHTFRMDAASGTWGPPVAQGLILARVVAGCVKGDGQIVHHINEDRFDNRRPNLQICNSAHEHGMLPHPRAAAVRLRKCEEAARKTWGPARREYEAAKESA